MRLCGQKDFAAWNGTGRAYTGKSGHSDRIWTVGGIYSCPVCQKPICSFAWFRERSDQCTWLVSAAGGWVFRSCGRESFDDLYILMGDGDCAAAFIKFPDTVRRNYGFCIRWFFGIPRATAAGIWINGDVKLRLQVSANGIGIEYIVEY